MTDQQKPRELHHTDGIYIRKEAYDKAVGALKKSNELIEHALELGHLGGGSTHGWGQNTLLENNRTLRELGEEV